MMIYIGDSRSARILAIARSRGWGQLIVRGKLRGRRIEPWVFDNGAFGDYLQHREFDAAEFEADLSAMASGPLPSWILAPDIVAGGTASLDRSVSWSSRCREVAPVYLAVQDGMAERDVAAVAVHFDGLFVGGTLPWKLATGEAWVRFAHDRGKPCHIGRVGTFRRVSWARNALADSIDSTLPLWSRRNMVRFCMALDQGELFL